MDLLGKPYGVSQFQCAVLLVKQVTGVIKVQVEFLGYDCVDIEVTDKSIQLAGQVFFQVVVLVGNTGVDIEFALGEIEVVHPVDQLDVVDHVGSAEGFVPGSYPTVTKGSRIIFQRKAYCGLATVGYAR